MSVYYISDIMQITEIKSLFHFLKMLRYSLHLLKIELGKPFGRKAIMAGKKCRSPSVDLFLLTKGAKNPLKSSKRGRDLGPQ